MYNGKNITFTVTATNNGPNTTSGLKLKDLLPTGLTFVSSTTSSGSFVSSTGIWTPSNLANGGSAVLTLTVKPNSSGSYKNCAYLFATTYYDNNKLNDTAGNLFTVHKSSDMQITNVVSAGPYSTAKPVVFSIKIKNNGPDTATGVNVNDLLPYGFTYVSSVATKGTYNASTGIWALSSQNPNVIDSIRIMAKVSTGNPDILTKQAVMTYLITSPSDVNGIANNFYMPKFNNALGTLKKIKVSRVITQTDNIKLENLLNSGRTISFSSTTQFTVTNSAGLLRTTSSPTYTNSFTSGAYDGTTDFNGTSGKSFGIHTGALTDTFSISSNLSNYIGAATDSIGFKDSSAVSFSPNVSTNFAKSLDQKGMTQYTVSYFYMAEPDLKNINNPATVSADQLDLNVTNNTATGAINSNHPLPVSLISFDCLPMNDKIQLEWTTSSEMNNARFEVERSEDGANFTKIGEEAGYGTTQDIHNYSFDDININVEVPVLYYCLKQVDFNGAFQYSEIRKVILISKENSVKVWYDKSREIIHADFKVTEPFKSTLMLRDINGKTLYYRSESVISGSNNVIIDMQGYSQGVYTLIISDKAYKVLKY